MPRRYQQWRFGKPLLPIISSEMQTLPADDLSGPYVYGGLYSGHFGHMVAEFSHRYWAAVELGADCPPFIICGKPDDDYMAPYAHGVLQYFGVKNHLVITRPTKVGRLLVPQSGGQLGAREHKAYHQYLQKAAERAGVFEGGSSPKKLAVLRDHLKWRRLVGEELLAAFLADQGYTLYRPEDHSLIDQLRAFANAEKVILADGSPAHLYDLLPFVGGNVFYYGRNRAHKLAQNSVAPKVDRVFEYRDFAKIMVPLAGQRGRSPNRSLHYAPLSDLTAEMKNKGFVDAILPDASADVIHRVAVQMVDQRLDDFEAGHSQEEVTTAELMRAHYETAKRFYALKRRTSPKARWDAFWSQFKGN